MQDNRISNNEKPIVVLSYTTTKYRFVPEQLEFLVEELSRYDWEDDRKLISRGLHMMDITKSSRLSITLSNSKISLSKYPDDKYIVYQYRRNNETITSRISKDVLYSILRYRSHHEALRYIRNNSLFLSV